MPTIGKILIINVAHPAIGSRIPDDHLPPLGLLCIAGPLIDEGYQVRLLDAELAPLSPVQIVDEVVKDNPPKYLLKFNLTPFHQVSPI